MTELIISLVAIAAILALGRLGMEFGAFYELTTTLLLFFAMMVVLRYWYPATQWAAGWFAGGAGYAAFTTYWVLFLAGCLPLILVSKRVTEDAVPRYPKMLTKVLGVIFGISSSAILICCLMTSLSVLIPQVWPAYDRQALLIPLDTMPITVYQTIERHVVHIASDDPSHTRFPTFEKTDIESMEKYWK